MRPSVYDWQQAAAIGGFNFVQYSDATYRYYCRSTPGHALNDTAWSVCRETIATGQITYANATNEPVLAATDLATVAAYDYTA